MTEPKRAEHPGFGIAWLYEKHGDGKVDYWCANCEGRLHIEVDDRGYPRVANHIDVGDCKWVSRQREIVNRFLWSAVKED